jgi:ADP-heptose:LPS heptosyltransferase
MTDILVLRTSFFAHMEAILAFISGKYDGKPDLLAHRDDLARFKKLENVREVLTYSGEKFFSPENISGLEMESLRKNGYRKIFIPCSEDTPAGYLKVFCAAKKISPRADIFFINPSMGMLRPGAAWAIRENLYGYSVHLLRVIDRLFSFLPRKKGTVLVLGAGYLGDAVSVIRAIENVDGKTLPRLTVLIKQEYSSLIDENKSRRFVTIKSSLWSFVTLMLRFVFLERFEKSAIVFPGDKRRNILLLLGIPERAGYLSPLFFTPLSFIYHSQTPHQDARDLVHYAMKPLWECLGKSPKDISPGYPFAGWLMKPPVYSPGTESHYQPHLFPHGQDHGFSAHGMKSPGEKGKKASLLLVPCGRWMLRKIPEKSLVMMAEQLCLAGLVCTVYAPSEYLEEMARFLPDKIKGNVLLRVDSLPLKELVTFLQPFIAVLGINSGLSHLCAAMGKKVYDIIGPGSLFTKVPETEGKIYYVQEMPCRPCKQYGWKNCPHGIACLLKIDYARIVKEIVLDFKGSKA